jgi:hypothetical protein
MALGRSLSVRRISGSAGLIVMLAACSSFFLSEVKAGTGAAGSLEAPPAGAYRVLEPIHSGKLTLFPVVRAKSSDKPVSWHYLTLDEGLKSGEVEITEAGKAQGLVRDPQHDSMIRRPGQPRPVLPRSPGDAVNTLVLINHSDKPLLLLAGEIVTGGKQDRVIGKDRIVPPDSDPLDLSVFCIEPGRWVESSPKFGAASHGPVGSFMVQPSIRSQAMVAQDQQQVWNAVHGSIHTMSGVVAGAGSSTARVSPGTVQASPRPLETSSYAKAMQDQDVSRQVDALSEPLSSSHHQVLEKLREEHAVGVVAAVNGRIVWADIFTDTDMLTAYWDKLVRSYAAEALGTEDNSPDKVTEADAQHFVDSPAKGTETSEGETNVYRYREVRGDERATFTLEALLPGTGFDVHVSRSVVRDVMPVVGVMHPRLITPDRIYMRPPTVE